MIVRYNSHMRRIMGDVLNNVYECDDLDVECELPDDFVAQMKNMRIVEIEGAVVVGSADCDAGESRDPHSVQPDGSENASGWDDSFGDLTGLECSVNHYHIDRAGDGSLKASATAGIVAAREFKRMIEATKIPGDFRLVVSANHNPCEPPFYGAVIRFHKIRPKQAWLDDNLDNYKSEGILTMEWTNPVR